MVYPHLCPIALFLALAFQIDAFEVDLEDLFPVSMQEDALVVNFKDSVLDKPLFCNAAGDSPWTYAGASCMFKNLTWRAGYMINITLYVIRRGAINILDSKSYRGHVRSVLILLESVTQAEKGKILGHKSPSILQLKYLKDHVDVNLQSLFKGGPASSNRSKPLHGLGLRRAKGAPYHIRNTPMYEQVKQDSEIIALYYELDELRERNANPVDIRKMNAKIKSKIERLRRIKTDILRDQWFKDKAARCLRKSDEETKAHASHLTPARAKVVKELYKKNDQSLEQRLTLIRSLLDLVGKRSQSKSLFGDMAFANSNTGGESRKAREQEAREEEAREEEAREQEAREQEVREQESREKEARKKEAREQEAREQETREKEARERQIRSQTWISENKLGQFRFCEKQFTELKWIQASSTEEEKLLKLMARRLKGRLCPFNRCLQTGKSFSSKRTAQEHYKSVHHGDRIYCPIKRCTGNQRPLTNAGAFARHLRESHHVKLGNNIN